MSVTWNPLLSQAWATAADSVLTLDMPSPPFSPAAIQSEAGSDTWGQEALFPQVAVQIRGWALQTQAVLLCWLQWAPLTPAGERTRRWVPRKRASRLDVSLSAAESGL